MQVEGMSAPPSSIAAELASTDTDPGRLAELAATHPELHQQIAAHPNAYPELKQWMAEAAVQLPPQQYPASEHPVPEYSAPEHSPAAYSGYSPSEYSPSAHPLPEVPHEQLLAPAAPVTNTEQEPALNGSGRAKAVFTGIFIGTVVGAALATGLLIWVLPGLFGSFIG